MEHRSNTDKELSEGFLGRRDGADPAAVSSRPLPQMERRSNTHKELSEELSDGALGRRDVKEFLHKEITERIIGSAFEVHKVLGYGFLEAVYQKALQVELAQRGLKADLERKIMVLYKNTGVGHYEADLFVEEKIIVEVKVAKEYNPADEAQLLNELKATGIKVGLLLNFGRTKLEFKRMVF